MSPESEPQEPACRICGCTEFAPCPGGCAWIEQGLCSACADQAAKNGLRRSQAAFFAGYEAAFYRRLESENPYQDKPCARSWQAGWSLMAVDAPAMEARS